MNFAYNRTMELWKSFMPQRNRNKIIAAKQDGCHSTLLFFWLQNIELAKERVKTRVNEGGHNIPENVIERRYRNGIKNLFDIYIPIVDEILIFDNSNQRTDLIAEKIMGSDLAIINNFKFKALKSYYERA